VSPSERGAHYREKNFLRKRFLIKNSKYMKLMSDRSNNAQNQQKPLQNDHKTTSKFTLEK